MRLIVFWKINTQSSMYILDNEFLLVFVWLLKTRGKGKRKKESPFWLLQLKNISTANHKIIPIRFLCNQTKGCRTNFSTQWTSNQISSHNQFYIYMFLNQRTYIKKTILIKPKENHVDSAYRNKIEKIKMLWSMWCSPCNLQSSGMIWVVLHTKKKKKEEIWKLGEDRRNIIGILSPDSLHP